MKYDWWDLLYGLLVDWGIVIKHVGLLGIDPFFPVNVVKSCLEYWFINHIFLLSYLKWGFTLIESVDCFALVYASAFYWISLLISLISALIYLFNSFYSSMSLDCMHCLLLSVNSASNSDYIYSFF
jgi:hypothetical protein